MAYAYQSGGNCYGRGDYYRGDYYRGDPGLLGNIFGGIKGAIGGFVKGGPLGAISGAVGGFKTAAQGTALAPLPKLIAPPLPGSGIQVQGPFGTGIQIGKFGPPPVVGPPTDMSQFPPIGTMTSQGFIGMCGIKGTRPNKSAYYKRIPGTLQGQLIPKGAVCVKTRRMNIANGRALRRAVRRAQGFAKMARRVMTFVDARAPRGRAKFKKKR